MQLLSLLSSLFHYITIVEYGPIYTELGNYYTQYYLILNMTYLLFVDSYIDG